MLWPLLSAWRHHREERVLLPLTIVVLLLMATTITMFLVGQGN